MPRFYLTLVSFALVLHAALTVAFFALYVVLALVVGSIFAGVAQALLQLGVSSTGYDIFIDIASTVFCATGSLWLWWTVGPATKRLLKRCLREVRGDAREFVGVIRIRLGLPVKRAAQV